LTDVVSDGRSDDFALFQERISAVYFFLFFSNYEENIISEPHSPSFLVDETCIKTGVEVFSSLLLERLKRVD
jgi:metal-dependent amidase/aminoacylase/carboxypeptidase family protein